MSDPRKFIEEQIMPAVEHDSQKNTAEHAKHVKDVKDKVVDNFDEFVENTRKGDKSFTENTRAGDKTFTQQVTDAMFSK